MSHEYAAEWIRKAEADKLAAEVCFKLARRQSGQAEIACFHAQQCAEKHLKALLAQAGKTVPRTHDLIVLGNMAKAADLRLSVNPKDLFLLNAHAVDIRYPGATAGVKEARRAVGAMNRIRRICRNLQTARSTA